MKKPNRHTWEEDSTHHSVAGDEYDEVWDYAEQLEAKNERLQTRRDQHTYCAYCGEEFPVDTEGAVDAVEAHIFACEKHPIAYIKKVLRDEVWADMTLGSPEEKRLFALLNLIDDKAVSVASNDNPEK